MKKGLLFFISVLFILSVAACSPRSPKMEFCASFVTYGGTPIPSYTGARIAEEPAPDKEGFAFAGWYTEEDFSLKRVTFPYVLQGDTTFYAKYIDLNVGNEGMTFDLNDTQDGYIATGFSGDSYSVVIPPEYNGLPVVAAGEKLLKYGNEVKKLYFSANLAAIRFDASNLYFLTGYVLTGESAYFSVSDGVLYSADGSILVSYPVAKRGGSNDEQSVFTIPDTVKTVKKNSFKKSQYLTKIIIGKGVENVEETFETLPILRAFEVPDSAFFCADEGVLYKRGASGKTLVSFPVKNPHAEYSLLSDTASIADNAFRNSSIRALNINRALVSFGAHSDTGDLGSIVVDEGNEVFYAEDGVLYSYDGTLILYPSAKTDKNYRIKDGTKYIASHAFIAPIYLETLTVPASVEEICPYALRCVADMPLADVIFEAESALSEAEGSVFGAIGNKFRLTLASRTPPRVDTDTDWLSYVSVIKVPSNVVDSYKVVWSGAKDIILPSDVVLTEYTVTFDADGGVPLDGVTCASMPKEVITERSGYLFAGWYIGETKVVFPFAVASDVTLRAEWTPID